MVSEMMLAVDHIFIALLFIVQPAIDTLDYRRYVARVEAGAPLTTNRLFRETIVRDWVALAVFLGIWIALERPVHDLGFVTPGGAGFWISLILVSAALFTLYLSGKSVKDLSEPEQMAMRAKIGPLQYFLPRTKNELHHFYVLSFTAGVAEEIIYRGFVIWYLALLMPLWAAVLVSALLFGMAHSYQGVTGGVRAGVAGLIMAGLYLFSGSIWLPIVAHILGDGLQGPMFVRILQDRKSG